MIWGWEPTEVHRHEYDDAGRVLQTVVERESEWDEDQRNLMAALALYEADLGPHGFPLSETMSPDADPDNPNGKYRYEVGPPVRDWAETALHQAQSSPMYSGENYDPARRWRVRRVERT